MDDRDVMIAKNADRREECLKQARQCWGELLVALSFESDEGLAELDFGRIGELIEELKSKRTRMRKLRTQRRTLGAMRGAGE